MFGWAGKDLEAARTLCSPRYYYASQNLKMGNDAMQTCISDNYFQLKFTHDGNKAVNLNRRFLLGFFKVIEY